MKFKSLIVVACLAVLNTGIAADVSRHVRADEGHTKEAFRPGYCEIEVINNSFDNVSVGGSFDDGQPLVPFNIKTYDAPAYISLYYNGYCHNSMFLDIKTFSGVGVFYNYAMVNTTIRVVPGFKKLATVKTSAK